MTYAAPAMTMAPPTTVTMEAAAMTAPAMTYAAAPAPAMTYAAAPQMTVGMAAAAPAMTYAAPAMAGAQVGSVMDTAFNALDRNHDGMITRSEFNAAMVR
mmetsp:Transcript_105393/g.327451  ORF Transcript_105393/g.327451 Transcript_105393/m.327451 type:complete len:100 (-) Transcript_105393:92-391(-)